MTFFPLLGVGAASGGGPPLSGTVIYVNSTPGPWSFLIPVGVTSVFAEGWGGGGAGSRGTFTKSVSTPGNGAGGAQYFKKTGIAVTGGVTKLTGTVGAGGNASAGTGGGNTTLASPGCTAHAGAAGTAAGAGAGGTGTTGGTSHTDGTNGGAVDAWDGGGAGNGGGDKTIQSGLGTAPGGGGAGGSGLVLGGNGAAGRVRITVT